MSFAFSGKKQIDGLLSGYVWQKEGDERIVINYGFDRSGWPYLQKTPASFFDPVESPDAVQQSLLVKAMQQWSAVIPVLFQETHDVSRMRLCFSIADSVNHLGYADIRFRDGNTVNPAAAEVFFDPHRFTPTLISTARFAAAHELGHVLGLKHPHDLGHDGEVKLPDALNDWRHTVLSYNRDANGVSKGRFVPIGPQKLDVEAAQYLYGANRETHAGDDVYILNGRLSPEGEDYTAKFYGTDVRSTHALWDAGGHDVADASGAESGVSADWRPESGRFVEAGNTIWGVVRGAVIEDFIGSAFGDFVTGNAADNVLEGGAGADRIRGARGDDVLRGEEGNDALRGGLGADRLEGGAGKDVFRYIDPAESSEAHGIDLILDFEPGRDKLDFRETHYSRLRDFTFMHNAEDHLTVMTAKHGGFELHFVGDLTITANDFLLF